MQMRRKFECGPSQAPRVSLATAGLPVLFMQIRAICVKSSSESNVPVMDWGEL